MNAFGFTLEMGFLIAAVAFILGLKLLSSPTTARLGNLIGAVGMGLAALLTMIQSGASDYIGIALAIAVGSIIGVVSAKRIEMTAMPQMVAVFNGLGGLASVLVAGAEMQRYAAHAEHVPGLGFALTGWASMVIGAVTFTGSMVAFAKLQELISGKALVFPGVRLLSALFALSVLAAAVMLARDPEDLLVFWGTGAVAALLGILLVVPIGGADMPVVVSLLNSYSGLAAMAAGFVVGSKLLVVSGSLVGAAGILLTRLMCKAMNRSLTNVIFGAFGATASGSGAAGEEKPMKEFSPLDAAIMLNNAQQAIIVTGYGLAVSQAQQNIREMADLLKARGVTVKYAIHPVAGRMPGHMNVLLAEANVPYEDLYDLDDINGEFENSDVAMIIGANDVVNPSAREDKTSPLYGMPILNADKAKTVIVLKRGRGRGFSGVDNPIFYLDNTGLVFGDAKKSLVGVVNELKNL